MIWINKKEKEAIKKIYDYMVDNERKHFQESGKPKQHIYKSVLVLKKIATL